MNIGTDGDAVRRSVLHSMARVELSENVPYHKHLIELEYMEMESLPLGVTVNYDGEHLCKRLRTNIISGSIKILCRMCDANLLRLFLKYLDFSDTEIYGMIAPDNKQNDFSALRFQGIRRT